MATDPVCGHPITAADLRRDLACVERDLTDLARRPAKQRGPHADEWREVLEWWKGELEKKLEEAD